MGARARRGGAGRRPRACAGRRRAPLDGAVLILGLASVGWAYETDQLTERDRQLVDATAPANTAVRALLDRAIDETNHRTGCAGSDDAIRRVLADEIHRATSRPSWVWSRGVLRAPGFSTFSAALERSPEVDRFAFPGRSDLYGALTAWQSVILATAGPCSTFEIAGVRVGSDKFDHFLDNGWEYWRIVDRTGDVDAAIAEGTRTERSIYGLLTSKTFSYADLRANWDGYRFYAGLLGPDSPVGRAADGCVAATAPFDWRAWVDPEWDEVINPPVYTHLVEQGVLRGLDRDREAVCAARAVWDADGWREVALPAGAPPYVSGPAPARRDPWQLARLCDPGRTEPLAPAAVRPRDEVRRQRRS
ncbi:MAG: hypothetical protein ABMB14_07325 [Myxococcota bacterium]